MCRKTRIWTPVKGEAADLGCRHSRFFFPTNSPSMMNYPKKLFRSLESRLFSPLFTAFYLKNKARFSFLRELKPGWTFRVFGREPPTVRDQHQTSGAVGHLGQVLVPFVTSQRTDFQQCMVCHQHKYTNYAWDICIGIEQGSCS